MFIFETFNFTGTIIISADGRPSLAIGLVTKTWTRSGISVLLYSEDAYTDEYNRKKINSVLKNVNNFLLIPIHNIIKR